MTLRDNAFFSGLDATSLERALPAFGLLDVAAGTVLFRRGRVARRLLLIVTGSVAVVARTGGARVVVARLGPGEFTGERALLRPPAHQPFTAIACERSRLAVAAGADLEALVGTSPGVGVNVARGVYRRLADATSAIDALVANR